MQELNLNYLHLKNALSACTKHNAHSVNLLAVSKTQNAERVSECAALGQIAFGENYVQEALSKINALRSLNLQWHLIGPLQSNKCKIVAENFDWVQTIDRPKIIDLLDQYRPRALPALNVLIQVNIDNEHGKSGCASEQVNHLADQIMDKPHLRLRGLMAIPNPETSTNGMAFSRMQEIYTKLLSRYTGIDTLSMGMSDDYPMAIAHGANLIRIGTALFGSRNI